MKRTVIMKLCHLDLMLWLLCMLSMFHFVSGKPGLIIEGTTMRPSFQRKEAEGMYNVCVLSFSATSFFHEVFGVNCPLDVPFGLANGQNCCYFMQRKSDRQNLRPDDPTTECKEGIPGKDLIPCPTDGGYCIDHVTTLKSKSSDCLL